MPSCKCSILNKGGKKHADVFLKFTRYMISCLQYSDQQKTLILFTFYTLHDHFVLRLR